MLLKYVYVINKLFFCVVIFLYIKVIFFLFLWNLFVYNYGNFLKFLSVIYFRFMFIEL